MVSRRTEAQAIGDPYQRLVSIGSGFTLCDQTSPVPYAPTVRVVTGEKIAPGLVGIGCDPNSNSWQNAFHGDIAEVLIYSGRTLSEAAFREVTEYLATKWGATPARDESGWTRIGSLGPTPRGGNADQPNRGKWTPDAAALGVLADSLDDDLRVFSPPSSDRAFWTSTPLPAKEWIQKAEGFLGRPIPELTEELYRDYEKTGSRERFMNVYGERLERAKAFGLAEALENQGRFISPMRESIQAILDEPSWVISGHDFDCMVYSGKKMDVDLGASNRAAMLSTLISWHGEALGRETVERTQTEIRRRIVEPLRKRIAGDTSVCWWVNADSNWNAVCLANTVYSALAAVPDKAVRAEVVGAAMTFINRFLDGFTMDGYCSEGIGYWEYGFGHFVLLAERLWLTSEGKINLYQDSLVPRIVTNPARLELSSGVYPAFADGGPNPRVSPWLLTMLSRRYDMERPSGKMASIESGRWTPLSVLDMALAAPSAPEQRMALEPLSPLRGWFEVAGILVSRPADPKNGLSVAMKGGHNAELHNHNDLGSYVVTAGEGAVLLDPGCEVYTKSTFSDRRYDSKVLSSYGHSVPVVDGQLQATGRQAEAKVLKTLFTPDRDEFALDLTSAYPVKGLNQLTRAFTYDRSGGTSLQIEDELHAERPMTFETALITYGTLERKQDGALNITNGANPNKSPYQLELRVCPKNPAANQFPDVFHASLATRHRQKPIFPIRQGAGGRF